MALWLSEVKFNLARIAILSLALIVSILIHYKGATDFDTFMWNVKPNNIDRNPERVWDLEDLQFLR
jgi:hypothetical protein